jgi:hypothetical protein
LRKDYDNDGIFEKWRDLIRINPTYLISKPGEKMRLVIDTKK